MALNLKKGVSSLVPTGKPLSPKQVIKRAREYHRLKLDLIKERPEGVYWLNRKVKQPDGTWVEEKVPALRKSIIRWLALFAGISTIVVRQDKERHNNQVIWTVTVRAVDNNGRQMECIGECSSEEYVEQVKRTGKKKLEKDIVAIAETRASNRAILSMLGGGDVSAEELESETE